VFDDHSRIVKGCFPVESVLFLDRLTRVCSIFEHFSWGEAMAFGALISAVDPVATLATFKVIYSE
jgi:hypothetical protein